MGDSRRLARLYVMLSCGVFFAAGVPFLVAPAEMTHFVGVTLTSVTADNDVRAVYGGVATGLAVFLVLALRREDWLEPALYVVLLTLGGLATGRVVSWLVAGWPDALGFVLHGAEALGVLAGVFVLRRLD